MPQVTNRSLPGTEKNPQGRLFAPVGLHTGDQWKHSPENWMGQSDTPSHNDPVAWHSSESSAPPRYDDPHSRQVQPEDYEGPDWDNSEYTDEGDFNEDFVDYSVDKKGRPMADYGSAVGMHLGDMQAAMSRPGNRDFVHPLRIPSESLVEPPRGNFAQNRPGGSIAAGPYKSAANIYNKETGEKTRDTRWSDSAANFAPKATDVVESGKTIAYRNEAEAHGSTSYRTLPETIRTWSEDVLSQPNAHPALRHVAELGYNPVARTSEASQALSAKPLFQDKPEGVTTPQGHTLHPIYPPNSNLSHQMTLGEEAQSGFPLLAAIAPRNEAFRRGHLWSMQKPVEQPDDDDW